MVDDWRRNEVTPLPDPCTSHVLIRDALARIAAHADTGTVDEYLACFTADAVWQLQATEGLPMAATRLDGIEELRASVVDRRTGGIQGPGTHTAHQVSSTHVTFAGKEAKASSLFLFYTHTNATPKLAGVGRYTDEFVWSGGSWLLRSRTITRD